MIMESLSWQSPVVVTVDITPTEGNRGA